MVRAKKHITEFWWSKEVEIAKKKYWRKWVEGPKGKLWVSAVYYDTDGITSLLYTNDQYIGYGIKLLHSELDQDYRIL